MIKRLGLSEFENIFPKMEEAFPPEEIKSYDQFVSLLSTDNYVLYGYYDEETLVGYALLCVKDDLLWLDYLNIFSEYQDKHYGSKFVKEILKFQPNTQGMFLEVEPIDSDDYNDNKVRRMRFYNRLNIVQLDVNYLFPTVEGSIPLNLCFIPNDTITFLEKESIQDMVSFVIKTVHKDIPHAWQVMRTYYDEIKDTEIFHFHMSDVDLDNENEVNAIGRLIYHTDPFIYPALLDSIDNSVACAKALLKSESIFNKRYIMAAKINGNIAGYMQLLEGPVDGNHEEMEKAIKKSLGYLPRDFDKVMADYFDLFDGNWEGTQIVSLAVLPEYRNMKVASKMLYSLPGNKTYSLACIKDNHAARELYRKCGFVLLYEYPGYVGVPCVELVKKGEK